MVLGCFGASLGALEYPESLIYLYFRGILAFWGRNRPILAQNPTFSPTWMVLKSPSFGHNIHI